ncbi:MAG: dihydrofolate reductase family protein [Pseudolysinimonas sp.]
MIRVRLDLFLSLDGRTSEPDISSDNPMGDDWGRLTEAYTATRTFREKVFGDTTGAGTTGVDERYASAFFDNVGAEIMGAAMFGLHSFPDDPDWKGWWGDEPPFGGPVFVLTHTAPRPDLLVGATTFFFRSDPAQEVLNEAIAAADGKDVRIGGGIRTAREFLVAGLVDELHLQIAPIILDRGARVWDDLRGLELTHTVTTEVAESGIIHVTFSRKGQA